MSGKQADERSFLTLPKKALLTAVLDRVILHDSGAPGAGEMDVANFIDRVVAGSPSLTRLFLEGLADIEVASRGDHSEEFGKLSAADQTKVLRRVESENPQFFDALVEHTYKGYYSNPGVLRMRGLEDTPPQPEGFAVGPPFDPELLQNVRKRAKLYRDA